MMKKQPVQKKKAPSQPTSFKRIAHLAARANAYADAPEEFVMLKIKKVLSKTINAAWEEMKHVESITYTFDSDVPDSHIQLAAERLTTGGFGVEEGADGRSIRIIFPHGVLID